MQNNIQSKFNYTVDLGVSATKSVMKLKKSFKDKISHIALWVFIVIMSAMLIWDISREASYTLDLIILIALCCVEIFNIVMPFVIVNTQRKFLRQVLVAEFDYTLTEMTKDRCVESYYKDNKVLMQNSCDLNELIAYEIKDHYIFLVFNNFASAIFDINTLENATQEEFEQELNKIITKNKLTKPKKRKF